MYDSCFVLAPFCMAVSTKNLLGRGGGLFVVQKKPFMAFVSSVRLQPAYAQSIHFSRQKKNTKPKAVCIDCGGLNIDVKHINSRVTDDDAKAKEMLIRFVIYRPCHWSHDAIPLWPSLTALRATWQLEILLYRVTYGRAMRNIIYICLMYTTIWHSSAVYIVANVRVNICLGYGRRTHG